MKIYFANKKLMKTLSEPVAIQKSYNQQKQKIMQRLTQLEYSPNFKSFSEVPATGLHKLVGDYEGCYALNLVQPYRMIIRPLVNGVEIEGDITPLESISEIEIVEITDYH